MTKMLTKALRRRRDAEDAVSVVPVCSLRGPMAPGTASLQGVPA